MIQTINCYDVQGVSLNASADNPLAADLHIHMYDPFTESAEQGRHLFVGMTCLAPRRWPVTRLTLGPERAMLTRSGMAILPTGVASVQYMRDSTIDRYILQLVGSFIGNRLSIILHWEKSPLRRGFAAERGTLLEAVKGEAVTS